MNHQVSKALVASAPAGTLFVLEDLTGVRQCIERELSTLVQLLRNKFLSKGRCQPSCDVVPPCLRGIKVGAEKRLYYWVTISS